jgi:hypothetical protein
MTSPINAFVNVSLLRLILKLQTIAAFRSPIYVASSSESFEFLIRLEPLVYSKINPMSFGFGHCSGFAMAKF